MSNYLKPDFEADLLALGEVRSVLPSELQQIDDDPGRPVVLTDALGSNAIVLFQGRPDIDFDKTVRTGNATRPTKHTIVDNGMHTTAASHTVNLPNPYSVLAYFPDAADGKGDASFYTMPEFNLTLPDVSRYITEQEARDLIAETAIPLPGGLFVSRPEAEAAHYAYHEGKSMAPMHVEDYAPNEVPLIKISVDPLTTEGSFTLLDAPSVTRGNVLQRLSYTGHAAMTGVMRNLPVYKHGDNNSIMQLVDIAPSTIDHTVDDDVFVYGYIDRKAFTYDDLIRMIRTKEGIPQEGALPPFKRSIGVHRALESGLVSPDSLVYAPTATTPILYKALTDGPDTPYFRNLRRELGPAFGQESDLIAKARSLAHDSWRAALASRVKVEPIATGLEQVATSAGIRRQREATITVTGGIAYIAFDGRIVIH
ncbi:MAG TPA: hypothetical protein VFB59_02835 [Candidatus Saccharimonadales bacterium]|nr:hypothetical protein [Candidatus Saccharimonadales bacterium]